MKGKPPDAEGLEGRKTRMTGSADADSVVKEFGRGEHFWDHVWMVSDGGEGGRVAEEGKLEG